MPIGALHDTARLIAATTNHLRVEGAALGDPRAAFHPAEGEWCAKEIVGHLVEADQRGFAGRISRILEEDRPELASWDQAQVAARRADCHKPWEEVLTEFTSVRRRGLLLLEELSEADLDRVGLHPEVGELRVRDVVHEWPFHDREHLRQLLSNVRVLLWPDLGNARNFSLQRGGGPVDAG